MDIAPAVKVWLTLAPLKVRSDEPVAGAAIVTVLVLVELDVAVQPPAPLVSTPVPPVTPFSMNLNTVPPGPGPQVFEAGSLAPLRRV